MLPSGNERGRGGASGVRPGVVSDVVSDSAPYAWQKPPAGAMAMGGDSALSGELPGKSNGRAASRHLASRRWTMLTGAPWSSTDTTRCHTTTERTMSGAANTLRGSPLCTDACRVRRRFSISAAAAACRPPASSPPPGTASPASTCRRARPHPPAPARAAPPRRAHLHLAAAGRLAAGHRRRQRLDGHRGQLARRSRRNVVEPGRRVDLPLLAAAGHRAGRSHVGQVAVSRPPDTPMSPT